MYLTTIEVWTVFIPFIISYLRMCIYHVPGLIFLWKNTFLEPIHAIWQPWWPNLATLLVWQLWIYSKVYSKVASRDMDEHGPVSGIPLSKMSNLQLNIYKFRFHTSPIKSLLNMVILKTSQRRCSLQASPSIEKRKSTTTRTHPPRPTKSPVGTVTVAA